MLLDVRKIVNAPGERMEFQFELDLSDVDFGGLYPAQEPVVVTGEVRNIAGMLLLDFTAASSLHSICDRCLKPFDDPRSVTCSYALAEEVEDEEKTKDEVWKCGYFDPSKKGEKYP